VEYKVLGRGTVDVGGTSKSLSEALKGGIIRDVEEILNALGAEGWDVVTLEPPFVFRRSRADAT
jgi:hypothetical protein